MRDELARSRQVELILEQVDALPTLSPVAARLMTLGSAEDVDIDEVVTLIESDPAMTATILGLCRKADRGLGDKIDTVRRAVVLLGFEQVRASALGVGVYELISEQGEELDRLGRTPDPDGEDGPSTFDRIGVWKHSVATASCAELLCEMSPHLRVRAEQAFVAGLLHDVGKLSLELVLPRSVSRVSSLAEQRAADFAPTARSILGIDQHTAGRRLAAKWMLPAPIADVMWLCGQPMRSLPDVEHKLLIALVTLSSAIARRNHLGWSGDFGPPPDIRMQAAELGIVPSRVESMTEALVERVVERCRVLRLDDETTPGILLQSISSANKRLSALNSGMQRQAALARRQGAVLEAIAGFHEKWDPRRSVVETLELIAQSSSRLFGKGFYAAVFQGSEEEPWQVHAFNPSGKLQRSCVAEPAGGRISGGSLASLADTEELSVAAISVLPWLSDYITEAPDFRQVRVLPICAGTGGGASAILLHDRDLTQVVGKPQQVVSLRGAWAAALQASSAGEFSRRLGEHLAEASRSLSEMQSLLTERDSMARLGEMTAGAAHEMNNPLTVIRGRSQLMAERLENERDKADAGAVASAAEHLSELITSLHLLASPPTPAVENHPIKGVVDRAKALAAERIPAALRVAVEVDEGVVVRVDRELVGVALAELLVNAAEAKSGAKVTVRAQRDPLDGRIHLVMTDDGPGMSAKALRHAFDPFFSEKAAGRQTGLGLSRARRLIELHGGEIRLDNLLDGTGVKVTILLPSGEAAEEKPSGEPDGPSAGVARGSAEEEGPVVSLAEVAGGDGSVEKRRAG